jgi:hypothetical protein
MPIPIAVASPRSQGAARLLPAGGWRKVLEHLGYVLLQLLLVLLRLIGERRVPLRKKPLRTFLPFSLSGSERSSSASLAGCGRLSRSFPLARTGADGSYLGTITDQIQATSYGINPIEVIARPHYC